MRRRSRTGAAMLVAAALAVPATANAAGTLDQQQTSSSNDAGLYSTQTPAQTFTAGITGGLDQADLLLFTLPPPLGGAVEPLTLEIRNVSAGQPGTSVLASTSIPMSALPEATPAFVPATFASPAAVTAGTKYALVLYTAHVANDCCGWRYQETTDPYSGGSFWDSHDPIPAMGNWFDLGGRNDFAFKTYVTPTPTAPITSHKKKCKKHKKKRSAESAKKKCKKKKGK